MSRARDNRRKLKKHNVDTVKRKKNIGIKKKFYKKPVFVVIIVGIIIVAFVASVFAVSNLRISKYTRSITKTQAREEILGFEPQISNLRALSNASRVADSFAAEDLMKDGKKIGEEAIIFMDNPDASKSKKIPKEAFMLLIVDNNLKILGLKPFKPTYFDIGGKVDFNKFFASFKGKTALSIINKFDGIYTDDSNTALVVKNKVREAMSLFYIEKYGEAKFDKISKGGFIFAERGTKVPDFSFTDENGHKYKLSDFKNYKIIAIGGNPNCGGCVSSIERLSYEFKKYNLRGVKFIVFSFSDKKSDAVNLTRHLPGQAIVVLDPDRSVSKKLKLNISPYIALIDRNLTLFYRGPGEPTRDTLSNIKEFLGGK